MTRTPIPRKRWLADLSATVLLLAVPIVGFWPTFAGPGYLPAVVGAAIFGVAIAAVAAWRGWSALTIAAITVVTYFIVGPALAVPQATVFGIPTLDAWTQLALGVVTSWKQILTTVAPIPAAEGFLIAPFLLTLVSAVLVTSLALRARHAAWALLPAGAFLALQIALGTSDPALPVIEGVVFAVVAIVWLAVRQAWAPAQGAVSLGEGPVSTSHVRRVLTGAGVVALAVVIGVATAGFAAPAGPRYVLRDVVIPPFDVKEYASPLQSFRGYVRDFDADPLFTVSGLPQGARVRIAAMDAYSGTVYNVSEGGAGSSSAFVPVRPEMSPDAEGTPASVHVQIADLKGVWLPTVGAVTQIGFAGESADDLRRAAHYNAATQTAVLTSGVQPGAEYDLDVVIPETPNDTALADTPFAPVRMPAQEGVPQDFVEIASQAVADAETPIEQVRALQQSLSERGFFSHGLEGEPLSRAGHGAERITTLLGSEQMVGDDEQYAVAMALLANSIGIPARVVMGFHPDENQTASGVFTATGENLHAWVEVAFDGAGWVPFDPTPPEDQVPSDQTTKPRADPKPQVLQPPPPQQEPVDLPPTVPDEREQNDDQEESAFEYGFILLIAGSLLLTLALLLAPFLIIGAIKASRRRRRLQAERSADRISGGWEELVDRAADYGSPVRVGGTRMDDATTVSTAFEQTAVVTLAARADAEVFGPTDPTDQDVAEFWRQVDDIVAEMGRSTSVWGRLRARLSLRSLLAGTRFALRSPRTSRREAGHDA
ncbi:transglutaminase family protein [Microbacterium sp. C7(2022)]|uniref:transglutaminase-like domain-containing protein n=1 Tax=Microbacterium sp. C7(2022) TaxID=2992759 RepID=UPI00237B07B2|nr:transglutaminase-like domain-containing protein [Microbacterium sp. C7(2022)]MDE0545146.1 transglutaminase-like domain-containing protein [Microbacterium sp. C7(2022)]